MDVRISHLDSGLRIVSCRMPQVQSVSLGFWIGCGGRHEPDDLCGVSHFIEHLLFKGTARLSARDISEAVEGRGGYLNAFTQEESTCFYAKVASEYAWKVLGVLGEMYRHPRMAPSDVSKERNVILDEIMMYRDEPEHLVEELMGQSLWKAHPLGRPLTGTPETLRRLTRERVAAFRNAHYIPAKTVFVLAGRIRHEDCRVQVEKAVGRIRPAPTPAISLVTDAVRQDPVAIREKKSEQAYLEIGVRLFGRRDERRHVLKILSVILGENMSSRLFQVIREQKGLAYSIQSSTQLFDETGALIISAAVDQADVPRAVALIAREIRRLKTRRVREDELRRAREYTVGQLRLGLESTSNQMSWAAESLLYFDRLIQPEETIAGLSAVSASDVLELARDVFDVRRTSLVLVTSRVSERRRSEIQAGLEF